VLQKSLRSEFDNSRTETDPVVINRLLAVGFDSLSEMHKKLFDAERKLKEGAKNAASKGLLGSVGVGSSMETLSSSSSSSSSPSSAIPIPTSTTTIAGIPVIGAPQLIGEKKWLAAEADRKQGGDKIKTYRKLNYLYCFCCWRIATQLGYPNCYKLLSLLIRRVYHCIRFFDKPDERQSSFHIIINHQRSAF